MATQDILINWAPQETRVAVVENGAVQELHLERTLERGLVGRVNDVDAPGGSRHVGQRYDPPATHLVEKPDTLHDLRDRLRRAVDAEQFELAAELRDRIRVLE